MVFLYQLYLISMMNYLKLTLFFMVIVSSPPDFCYNFSQNYLGFESDLSQLHLIFDGDFSQHYLVLNSIFLIISKWPYFIEDLTWVLILNEFWKGDKIWWFAEHFKYFLQWV